MSDRVASPARPASGRYERKFFVRELTLAEVTALVRVHPALFRTAYPPRWVNNVYFDLPGLEHFTANVEGSEHRVKYRIRWYGDRTGTAREARLERKGKHGLLGTKVVAALPPLEVSPGWSAREVERYVAAADLPDAMREELRMHVAVLSNRYHRAYFLSADGRFRLTLDSQLEYRPLGRLASPRLAHELEREAVVVELKYDAELDLEAAPVASAFPFRVTKSSKYASGVERFFA